MQNEGAGPRSEEDFGVDSAGYVVDAAGVAERADSGPERGRGERRQRQQSH